MLRAYRWKRDKSWDGRHVLPRLYKEAQFDSLVSEENSALMAENFGTITIRWANDHRYASPAKLEKFLNDIGATKNVKGDKLKRNSTEMYDAAEYIVGLGINKWKS